MIWKGCANAYQATSIAANEFKPRVFAEQVDRWRDQLIGLQETLVTDRLLPLVARYQISSNERRIEVRFASGSDSPRLFYADDWHNLAFTLIEAVGLPRLLPAHGTTLKA